MKRARDQSSTIVDTGNHHAVVGPARAAASPAVVPDGGARVSETTTSKPTLLPPPPPIQPFSDDSDDARPAGDALSSSSSSSSSSAGGSAAAEEGRRKRAKREPQQELEGWRAAANAILSAGVKEDGAGSRSSKGESSGSSRKSFAVVCSSNVNRSIMAEILLKEHDIRAQSYGTGREVRLPGKDSKSPQSFPFGTPYVEIRDFLARQNEALFRRNSVLGLLERNATTKRAPERWQSLDGEHVASFDVVVCFESRVFDLVVEGILTFLCSLGVNSRCCGGRCHWSSCRWSWCGSRCRRMFGLEWSGFGRGGQNVAGSARIRNFSVALGVCELAYVTLGVGVEMDLWRQPHMHDILRKILQRGPWPSLVPLPCDGASIDSPLNICTGTEVACRCRACRCVRTEKVHGCCMSI
ncbi:conserved unknown protein [Ectocarpus siliculosus]|uniref:protein-serine/threonine phosphatase n=1 Tax=Ectocarpus siliculosus TaxID=2880 RepID=D8LTB5_ECTSI|nr:conserved unknown protein [Ectocarpus siliculosus]|eukprot:CBN77986.1 conserved unknown protein [Ectocarpus siliculosus]